MMLVQAKAMRLVCEEKNTEKSIQNICTGFINTDVDGEVTMHNLAADSIKDILKVHAECVGRTCKFLHRKLNEFDMKNMHLQK